VQFAHDGQSDSRSNNEEIYLHGYDTVFDVTLSIFTVQVINLQMTLPSACAA
jgi:hypothetical protein